MDSLFSQDKIDSLCPMYFGVSCALFAIRLLSTGPTMDEERWSHIRNKMLQGSANLLGLLVWKVQSEHKIQTCEREVVELKKRRSEDAKANEKVLGIFAAQEQNWFIERKKLRQHIGNLLNDLRVLEMRNEKSIYELNEKLKSKDKELEEFEEKVKKAEKVSEELREKSKREAQEHSCELLKHKTAFLEFVSNQRMLEAEMGRALRQVEAAKQELDVIFEQKEEAGAMVQKLSIEVVKLRKDLEQKEKILSAMLRKWKLDTAEKQVLLKEVKLSKAKRKQAEFETERWKAVSESTRHERNSLRSVMSKQATLRLEVSSGSRKANFSGRTKLHSDDILFEYIEPEAGKETEEFSPHQYSQEGNDELAITPDIKRLEGWVQMEAEKYTTLIEQRHHLEIDAFAEQLRLKDEKLDALRWRFLSLEMETKRLQSHIEGLKQENRKLEALLFDRESELKSLKTELNTSPRDPDLTHDTVWSKVVIVKRKPGEKVQENLVPEVFREKEAEKTEENPFSIHCKSPKIESEDKKITAGKFDLSHPLKMDLHALGVSYKIKRLKQQLLMLERFIGHQDRSEVKESDNRGQGFPLLANLLSKQVGRYESLQGKTDDICKRMLDNDLNLGQGDSKIARTKEETKTLEQFLEETFQLQRYMVATGQKLMETQNRIASGFEELNGTSGLDMNRFSENVRTLLREVQRGLEVRISRIIGDLEGTLACQGIISLRN